MLVRTWFSPFPKVERGKEGQTTLESLDEEIQDLQSILDDLKRRRNAVRAVDHFADDSDAYAHYLDIVESQRRAERELSGLLEERLAEVIRADLAYDVAKRGEYFPYPSLEEQAKEFLQTHRDRMVVITTVAFFGMSVTFSTILSATRGNIGLMSLSLAAFCLSFSVCIYAQWLRPQKPVFAAVAYPHARRWSFRFLLLAAFASFVGIVLMGITLAVLDLNRGDQANSIDTRLNVYFGGWLTLLPIVFGFIHGIIQVIRNGIHVRRIKKTMKEASRVLPAQQTPTAESNASARGLGPA